MESQQGIVKQDKKYDISAEAVLYDALENIFSYLSLKDLHRVAAVCKSWQDIANKEISRRNDIESLILPIMSDAEPDDDEDDYDINDEDDDDMNCTLKYLQDRWHVSDSLRSLPRLVILFSDGNGPSRQSIDDFYLYYCRRLKRCSQIGVFDALGVSMDDKEILGESNSGVGIMIPSTPKLKIDVYLPYDGKLLQHVEGDTISNFTDEVVNSLLSTEEERSCFIFLSNRSPVIENPEISYSRSFLSKFCNSLKRRCKPGTYSLWGGEISDIVTDIDNHDRNNFAWSILIRISGPAVYSWSIVLKSNLSNAEKEGTLLNFRSKIYLKSNSIAIAMAPSNKDESFAQRLSKTELFKKVFPKIPLIGIYEQEEFIQIGVNSEDCDPNPVLAHANSVAYLIITTA